MGLRAYPKMVGAIHESPANLDLHAGISQGRNISEKPKFVRLRAFTERPE